MTKTKEKKRRNSLIMLAASVSIVIGGLVGYCNSTREYQEIKNATYQGWKSDGEGKKILYFDPERKEVREGDPDYRIWGDFGKLGIDEEKDMYKTYDLHVKIPRRGQKEIVKATEVSK